MQWVIFVYVKHVSLYEKNGRQAKATIWNAPIWAFVLSHEMILSRILSQVACSSWEHCKTRCWFGNGLEQQLAVLQEYCLCARTIWSIWGICPLETCRVFTPARMLYLSWFPRLLVLFCVLNHIDSTIFNAAKFVPGTFWPKTLIFFVFQGLGDGRSKGCRSESQRKRCLRSNILSPMQRHLPFAKALHHASLAVYTIYIFHHFSSLMRANLHGTSFMMAREVAWCWFQRFQALAYEEGESMKKLDASMETSWVNQSWA